MVDKGQTRPISWRPKIIRLENICDIYRRPRRTTFRFVLTDLLTGKFQRLREENAEIFAETTTCPELGGYYYRTRKKARIARCWQVEKKNILAIGLFPRRRKKVSSNYK